MKKAIIVGCNGQDGRLLNDLLIRKGYKIIGIDKSFIKCPKGISSKPIDIRKTKEVFDLIDIFRPDEIYYLAAYHNSAEDMFVENVKLFQESYEIHVSAFVNFLEGIKKKSPLTKIFYAASSHIFGESDSAAQDEDSPINPDGMYAVTKAAGLFMCRFYRKTSSIFATTGILYNHESSLREERFISKKIVSGAINIKNKKQDKLVIGNLRHEIDWGFAPDYVDAMHKIVNCDAPDDFIVATGKKNKVLDFVEIVFGHLGLEWKTFVDERKGIITKKNCCRWGNPKKLMDATGWKPSVDFKEMVQLLVDEDLLHCG